MASKRVPLDDPAAEPSRKRVRMDFNPTLFAAEDEKTFVVDIPMSLSHAQAFAPEEMCSFLMSTSPRELPFEQRHRSAPKSRKLPEWRARYQHVCLRALAVTDRHFRDGSACLSRIISRHSSKVSDRAPGSWDTSGSIKTKGLPKIYCNRDETPHELQAAEADQNEMLGDLEPASYRVPPRSAFALTHCEDTRSFDYIVRQYASPTGLMDLFVLDPPWFNSSADRKGDYKTTDFRSLKDLLLDMDLELYLKKEGLLAVWVTNSEAARNIVLGEGGLFEQCNVTLVEEWIWLKITVEKKPVLQFGSDSREPYEALLIGRKNPSPSSASTLDILQRVVMAVPDLHSRKPNLKDLIGRCFFEGASEYKACEIFARNLTAGWLAWGNECLKFNWLGHWASKSGEK